MRGGISSVDIIEVAKCRCDYIKWKQEQLFSVTWSLEYPGVRTQLLEYSHDGTVTSTQDTTSWVVADR